MKFLTVLFMFLITTPVLAVKIDANTPIEWNWVVVLTAYDRTHAYGWPSDYFKGGAIKSVSSMVSICIRHGSNWKNTREEIEAVCKKFGEELVNINNEIASVADNASKATTKSSCENGGKAVWVAKEGVCVPKNPCLFVQYKNYCIDTELTGYYKIPKGGNITSAEVVNIYIKYLGFNCKVVERDILKEYGFTFVPCKGADYRMLQFDADDVAQNVTDLFCFIDKQSGITKSYYGWPTICTTAKSICETIKGLIGNKIRVEYKEDKGDCYIGEWAEDATGGVMWTDPITVE